MFRLPSKSEWGYACRAETGTRVYWGDDPSYSEIGTYAWYDGNASFTTHDVGGRTPNAWGLYDMSGNVWEWCADWYGTYFSGSVTATGASSGSLRVDRGGGWGFSGYYCRSAYRGNYVPSGANTAVGFRLSR